MTQQPSVLIELTQGNLNNAHFYLRHCLHLFAHEVIGAPDQADGLGRTVSVHYDGIANPSKTDIAGPTKLFFRRRGPIRAFFARHQLRAGDQIRLSKTGPWTYTVSPVRA